jgi:anaerobic carbon-monoxide dehydrogenase catalytic subunit
MLSRGARCSLATGWASNIIAAELQDIISGTPAPTLSKIDKYEMISGFSLEAIIFALGGSFRGSLRPLIDNIVNGRIRGIAGLFNCDKELNNNQDMQVALAKELIKNDVMILFTGDNPLPLAKSGVMVYEGAKYAGEGLHSVCEAVGLPPVINMGNSIDSCRVLIATSAIVREARLGDISDLPVCIASTEGMNEKSVTIGQCFVSSGFYTIFGGLHPIVEVPDFVSGDMERTYGGMWDFETDPINMAQKMIAHIDKKRKALGIDKARDRVLYDMAMRRELI